MLTLVTLIYQLLWPTKQSIAKAKQKYPQNKGPHLYNSEAALYVIVSYNSKAVKLT
jgi:hypothetical protein